MSEHSSPPDFLLKTSEAALLPNGHISSQMTPKIGHVYEAERLFAARRFAPGTRVMHYRYVHWGEGTVVSVPGTRSMERAVLFEGFDPNPLPGFFDDDESDPKGPRVVHCNVAELYVPVERQASEEPVCSVTFLFKKGS